MSNFLKPKLFVAILSLALIFLVSLPAHSKNSGCPSVNKIKEAIKKSFGQDVEIVKVTPSEMDTLCQIQIKFRGRNSLLYIDKKGDFLIAGRIFDAKSGKNLTKEVIAEINKLSPEELKKLDKLAAFTLGNKGPVIYLVTDPQCPYCKKAEEILEPLVKENKVTVKYVLFPLRFHKGAKEECISIICDNKGLEGFKNRYRSENQCEKGKKQVEESINFLMSKGIGGTPTYIFPDGKYHSGVMSKEVLEERLSKFK